MVVQAELVRRFLGVKGGDLAPGVRDLLVEILAQADGVIAGPVVRH